MLRGIVGFLLAVVGDPAAKRTGGDVMRTSSSHYQELLDKAKQENRSVDDVIVEDLKANGIKPGENITVITRNGAYKIR
jgi:hypothetical protein